MTVARNRQQFLDKVGVGLHSIARAHGIHGARIMRVSAARSVNDTDGLCTNKEGLFLIITVADCFPVFFHDRKKQAVGLAHTGWRGVAKGIVPKMVSTFKKEFGSKPVDLKVTIGPGIRACHFEVREDVARVFGAMYGEYISIAEGKMVIDLPGIIAKQLQDRGIVNGTIIDMNQCTYCLTRKYFSWRREQVLPPRVMMALIGLVKGGLEAREADRCV